MKIGGYDLLETLGHGGMGVVSLARDPAGRLVALKIVHPEKAANPQFIELLEVEAAIIARLSHPNVVRILRLGEAGGRWFIAMELVNGATLRELLDAAAGAPLPIGACVAAAVQVCRGAHAAHELKDDDGNALGLVHRDITPHNVIVDENGAVKLLDFGVASVGADGAYDDARGVVTGKPAYLSPEQARGQPLDRRSDVFAIGTLLWELFAGRRRILSEGARAAVAAIAGGWSPDILDVRDDIPRPFVDVLSRALAHDRDARFATAHDFAEALEGVARETSTPVTARELGEVMERFAGERLVARRDRQNQGTEPTLSMPLRSPAAPAEEVTVADWAIASPTPSTTAPPPRDTAPSPRPAHNVSTALPSLDASTPPRAPMPARPSSTPPAAAPSAHPPSPSPSPAREASTRTPTKTPASASPALKPLSSPGRPSAPLALSLPVVARGENFEVRADARVAVGRVWARPDLTREEGAKSAEQLMGHVAALIDTAGRATFVLDVRDARMVLGARTFGALERMFAMAEAKGVRFVAWVSPDPLQRLDFVDLVARVAPRDGCVVAAAAEVRRIVL